MADYRARSARYRASNAGSQVAGLEARWRLAQNDTGTIPASAVLGTTEAGDARMDQLRLMSLGVRKTSESSSDIYLVDLDTANVSVLRDGEGVHSGVDTTALAAGQMVTQAARRRANRELVMVSSGGAKTSVTPNSADWKGVRAPVLVNDVADFAQVWATRAPSLIRPRVLAENIVVLSVDEVCDLRWAPGEQALAATVVLAEEGGTVDLVRRYSAAAPGAIPCLANLLTSTEDRMRFISGDLRRTSSGFAIDPLAVMTDNGLVVPDLMPASNFEAEVGELGSEASPLGAVLDEALAALDDGVHRGLLASTSGWLERLNGGARSLDAHGLARLAEAMRRCAAAVDQVRTGGRQANPGAPQRWLDVYIALLLAREQVHQ